MRALPRFESLYVKFDSVLEEERVRSGTRDVAHLQAQQVVNDQAYFLLCWGQLETEIVEACRDAIRSRRSHPDWQIRRSWYLYNPDERRISGLSFEERTALVLDRDAGKGSPWATTMMHYATRNEIAHGGISSTRIDVVAFVQDCYAIQSALRR